MVMILNIHLCEKIYRMRDLTQGLAKKYCILYIIYMNRCTNLFKSNILCSKKKEQKGMVILMKEETMKINESRKISEAPEEDLEDLVYND